MAASAGATVATAELEAAVARVLRVPAVRLVPHAAGGSRGAFRVEAGDDPEAAFLRLDDGESGVSGTEFDLRREAEIMRRVRELGLPVPAVLGAVDDPPGTVLEFVPGESRFGPEVAEAVGAEFMGWIAAVHAVDPASLPVGSAATVTEAVRDDLRWWDRRAAADGIDRQPLVALAARVLDRTLPDVAEPPCFVHGDVGPGNFLVRDGRVAAILDWEMAHLGDAHEDLAWLWMRGAHSEFGDPWRRFREYEAAAGTELDHDRLRWHLAFVIYKTVVAIRGRLHRPGGNRLVVTQHVLLTVYEALLGWAVAALCGSHLQLLTEEPEEEINPAVRLVDRLVPAVAGGDREVDVVVEHLRAVEAQRAWRQRRLADDLRSELGRCVDDLAALVASAEGGELGSVARVVARDADRACWSLPPALRRVRRAQRIGLGIWTNTPHQAAGQGERQQP